LIKYRIPFDRRDFLFLIPAIVLFWKHDTLVKRGALAALILGIASLGILLYVATVLKIEF